MKRSRTHTAGFTLIELSITLSILVVTLLLAAGIFRTCMEIFARTQRQQTTIMHQDMAIALLRRDVWNSERMELVGPQTLRIHQPDDRVVTWEVVPGTVRTIASGRAPHASLGGIVRPGVDAPHIQAFSIDDIWREDELPLGWTPTMRPAPQPAPGPAPESAPGPPPEPMVHQEPDQFRRTEQVAGETGPVRFLHPAASAITFQIEPATLVVRVASDRDDTHTEVRLFSQLQIGRVDR